MDSYDVTVKRLDPVRLIALGEELADHKEIDAAAARLYPRLHTALAQHGLPFSGVSYALYEEPEEPDKTIRFTVGLPVSNEVSIEEDGISTVEVPPVDRAATTVVKGPPTLFADAFRSIHDWVQRTGERAGRFEREVYLDCDGPRDTWVTELQVVLERSD